MKNQSNSQSKGFTIIETLVAITILIISIAGPLTIASKGLNAAIYARDYVVATYLAQDAMEYLKNIRDYNVINNLDWLDKLLPADPAQRCSDEQKNCVVDTLQLDFSGSAGLEKNPNNMLLYLSNDPNNLNQNGYSHKNNAVSYGGKKPTAFTRRFWIEDSLSNNSSEKIVKVKVSWKNGTVDNEVVVKDSMFNIVR